MVYGYIYLIRNKINNKLYIGQTINNFDKRYANNIILNTHNKHLKSSLEKYGIDNFIIIKEFDKASSKEELDLLEDMYIKIYNTTNDKYGYNKRFGGHRGKNSEETKHKMSEAHKKESIGEEVYNKQLECLAMGNKFESGKNNPSYGTGMIYIAIDVKDNKEYRFNSRLDAVEFVKGNKSELYKASRGKQHKSKKYPDGNYYKGYLWYVEER